MEVGEEVGLKFQSTEKLREFLRKVAATTTVSDKFRMASLKYADGESVVSFAFLWDVYEELRPGDWSPIHEVLADSSFFLESPKPREKSEELKARLKKLQEMVDQNQYDESMTSPSTLSSHSI